MTLKQATAASGEAGSRCGSMPREDAAHRKQGRRTKSCLDLKGGDQERLVVIIGGRR